MNETTESSELSVQALHARIKAAAQDARIISSILKPVASGIKEERPGWSSVFSHLIELAALNLEQLAGRTE